MAIWTSRLEQVRQGRLVRQTAFSLCKTTRDLPQEAVPKVYSEESTYTHKK